MPVFTVHEPPQRSTKAVPDPERIVFVREGFSFWAFLFAALWMARYRMWLVLLLYLVIAGGVEIALRFAGVGAVGIGLGGFAIALLVGMEASTLRRFALRQRGFRDIGIASGEDLEDAERRFFDSWVRAAAEKRGAPPAASGAASVPPVPPVSQPYPSDIVGLFPEAGASR
ncbi:MAG: DUF2628 domain-containing protein [Hyphomicrobiales bacterium]|jgi:Protein of unknown function (DUF2628)|nr:DUF2628 domain-containing protein [Hyphomicrobiales bacterium]